MQKTGNKGNVLVYHAFGQHVFPGPAFLRQHLGDQVETLTAPAGRPATAAALIDFIRQKKKPVVIADHALPVLQKIVDLSICSIVPVAHPVTGLMRRYQAIAGRAQKSLAVKANGSDTSTDANQFVRTRLNGLANNAIANVQTATLAGGRWQQVFAEADVEQLARRLTARTRVGIADDPDLMNRIIVSAILEFGIEIRKPITLHADTSNATLEALNWFRENVSAEVQHEFLERNKADLLLFDACAKAVVNRMPAGDKERDRISETAGHAAEVTGHRRMGVVVLEKGGSNERGELFRPEPTLGWWPKGNSSFAKTILGRDVIMEVDGFGYRPVVGQPETGEKSFSAYGCSITFGWGISASETFCSRLQTMLPSWRIENHGMNGFGTAHNLIQLERDTLWEAPNFVTFCWIPHHLFRSIGHHSVIQGYQFPLWLSSPISVHPKAYIAEDGELHVKQISFKRPELSGIDFGDFGPDQFHINLITARLFERAASIVRSKGGHFFVTIMRGTMSPPLRAQLDAADIPVVDASVEGREYSLLPDDGHPNGKANEIFASKIYDYVTAFRSSDPLRAPHQHSSKAEEPVHAQAGR